MKTRTRQLQGQYLAAMVILSMLFASLPACAQYYGGLAFNMPVFSAAAQLGQEPSPPVQDQEFGTPQAALRNARTIYGLQFAYRLSEHLALQSNYGEKSRLNYSDPLSVARPRTPDARGYTFDLISQTALSDRFSLFGRVGFQTVRTDIPLGLAGNIDPGLPSLGHLMAAARMGIGVRYDISNSLGLRLEAERFRSMAGSSLGEFSADNVSFGLRLKF